MTTTLVKLHATQPIPAPSTSFHLLSNSLSRSDKQQQQQHISLTADFLWALFKPFVATVSTGQALRLCSCVALSSPCHVALSVFVLRHVACGLVACDGTMYHCAWREFMARCDAECHQTAKGQKRFVPTSKTRRHKQHTHASLFVCLSVPLSLSHSSTVQAMLSRATGYCTLSQ